jgi:hypothetical protein
VQLYRVGPAAFVGGEVVALRWSWQCVGEALSKQVGGAGRWVRRELILKFRDSPRRRRTRWYGEEWGGKGGREWTR